MAFAWLFRGCQSVTVDPVPAPGFELDIPVLLLVGRRDAVSPSLQQQWRSYAPKLREVTGDGHSWGSSAATRTIRRWVAEQG